VPKTVVIRTDGTRWYLKLSSYDVARGIYGLESQNELVASRLFDLFGLPHVRYALQNAVVRLDGREQRAWVAESADFVPKGWSSRSLGRVYERERKEGEDPYAFCVRMGWAEQVWCQFVADYLIANRDRLSSNTEVLFGPEGETRLAPVFDCGLSLTAPYALKRGVWQHSMCCQTSRPRTSSARSRLMTTSPWCQGT
jgi:hypothetical protein